MASLPYINTFSAICSTSFLNGDYTVRAHCGAEGAGNAFSLVGNPGRRMSFLINNVFFYFEDLLGTGSHTESAALA